MPRRGKTLSSAGQLANISGIGLTPPQPHRDCLYYDVEWLEPEVIDAEVSRLVNGSVGALRNPKKWRNSTSSGYSSHSPPLSAGSYSTCCASVLRNSVAGTLGVEGTLGLTVIHEAEAIPRPIWPCASVDSRELHFVGCETVDCEGLSASCSYARAYTYASRCRNAHRDSQQPSGTTARDVLLELSRTLNSVIDGESAMTPDEILRDISHTVSKGIEANGTTSTGVAEEHVYRLSSSSSSGAGRDSVTVNPINFKLYGKSAYSSILSPSTKLSRQCTREGKRLLLQSVAKSSGEHGKRDQCEPQPHVPAVFLVPRCKAIYPQTLHKYETKSVKGNNNLGEGRLMTDQNNFANINCKRTIPRLEGAIPKSCYSGNEPVYSTQLDPSDESSSYGAVGKPPNKPVWNQDIEAPNKSLDFTLDGSRAERLNRKIARSKRRRQWCRIITAIFGLVFFVLSVVVVSLTVTRGRKIFGSIFLIQPLVIKLWQLRMKRKDAVEEGPPQLVKKCENGVCSMAWERSPKTSKVE
ncbi:hypothetical protein PV326_011984 [Microctonus aethiopoides]|nr:hypothetical protein PV326_011984 [Microctonus aethiopoides]